MLYLCYNFFDVTGKQVKILYEPVAVRHIICIALTESRISGKCHWNILRRQSSVVSSRNTRHQQKHSIMNCGRRFGVKNKIKGEKEKKMKSKQCKLLSLFLCVVLIAAMALFTTACDDKIIKAFGIGQGSTTETTTACNPNDGAEVPEVKKDFTFIVVDKNGNETTFQISTAKATVGEALLAEGLIEGESGAYGLYVKKVNGILADYDINKTYWAFYINGEYAFSGVDTTPVEQGATYSFKVEK